MLKTETISFEVVGDNDLEDGIIYSTVLIEWYGMTLTALMDKTISSGMVTLGHIEESIDMFNYTLLLKEVEKNQKGLAKLIN